jgi:hypothetical protein
VALRTRLGARRLPRAQVLRPLCDAGMKEILSGEKFQIACKPRLHQRTSGTPVRYIPRCQRAPCGRRTCAHRTLTSRRSTNWSIHHGSWLSWSKAKVQFSRQTADRYQNIFEHRFKLGVGRKGEVGRVGFIFLGVKKPRLHLNILLSGQGGKLLKLASMR